MYLNTQNLNQGCRYALKGMIEGPGISCGDEDGGKKAQRSFAFSFQGRATCDFLWEYLQGESDEKRAAEHKHQFDILKQAHHALIKGAGGKPRARVVGLVASV